MFGSPDTDAIEGASEGEEIVVPEAVAAFFVRQRAVDILEVIDPRQTAL